MHVTMLALVLGIPCLLLSALTVTAEEAAACQELPEVLLLQTEVKTVGRKRQELELVAASQSAAKKAAAAAAASQPAETVTYYWPMKDGGLTRNGYANETAPDTLNVPPTWSFVEPFDGIVRSGGLIDDIGDVYISSVGSFSASGNVYRFDGQTGRKKWATPMPLQVPASPALYNGNIYVLTNDSSLHCLSIDTGREAWNVSYGDMVAGDTASLLAGEGMIVFGVSSSEVPPSSISGTYNNLVVAADSATGAQLWTFVPEVPTYNLILSMANEKIIFADAVGTVYALAMANGQLLWNVSQAFEGEEASFTTGGAVQSPDGSTVFSNGVVTLSNGTAVGRACAYDTVTGIRLWHQDFPLQANVAPAVGTINGQLSVVLALGPNPPLPVPGSGYDILPAQVVALNAIDGTVVWSYTMPTWGGSASGDSFGNQHICWPDSSSTPTIAGDGTVYLGHEDGYLYAIKDANADGTIQPSEASAYNTGNAFQGSVALGPGMLVATPCNGVDVWISS